MSWNKTVILTIIFSTVIYVLSMAFITLSFADDGVEFTAKGTLWPKNVVKELNAATNLLKDMRKSVKYAEDKCSKSSEFFTPIKDSLNKIELRLNDVEKFKAHKLDVYAIYDDLNVLRKMVAKLEKEIRDNDYMPYLIAFNSSISSLYEKMEDMNKNLFGLSLYASSSFSGSNLEVGGVTSVGLGLYLQKGDWMVRPQLGVGMNLASKNLSWVVLTSVEYNFRGFYVGPYVSLEQDLGDLRGSESFYSSLGVLLRKNLGDFSLYMSVGGGVNGKKGDKVGIKNENRLVITNTDPSYSPSVNGSIGINYDVL